MTFKSEWLDWKASSVSFVSGSPTHAQDFCHTKIVPSNVISSDKTTDIRTQSTDKTDKTPADTRILDGHRVDSVISETPKSVIFRDPDGKVWRRVHSWGMTWPIEVKE